MLQRKNNESTFLRHSRYYFIYHHVIYSNNLLKKSLLNTVKVEYIQDNKKNLDP